MKSSANNRARRRFLHSAAAALIAGFGLTLATSTALAGGGQFGVVTQSELIDRDFARMERAGVPQLRLPFWWHIVEPSRGNFDWSYLDATIGAAADSGVRVLPFVYGSPSWIADRVTDPPVGGDRQLHAWARMLRAAVRRYGPRGDFWQNREQRLPIREWQIWNEPNFAIYWSPEPSPNDYASLLETSARAIRSVDKQAEIMLAGVAPIAGGLSPEDFLRQLYTNPGIAASFDAAALHPYSPSVFALRFQLRQIRREMALAGDRHTPLAITEIGWGSAGPPAASLVSSPAGQAARLGEFLGYLGRTRTRWRLSFVFWYAWQDTSRSVESRCDFCAHAGLFTVEGTPKPAWSTFRRLLNR